MDVLGALQELLCIIKNIATAIVYALVYCANVVIDAVGAALELVVLLLPDIPAAPAPPESDILNAVNWIFPVGAFLTAAASFLAMYVVFLGSRVIARWVKAI